MLFKEHDMEVIVSAGDIIKSETGAIILYVFEGETRLEEETALVDGVMGGVISQLVSTGEIKGKLNQNVVIHTLGKLSAPRLAVVGLGKKADLTLDKIRGAIAEVCRLLQRRNVLTASAVTAGVSIGKIDLSGSAQAMTEGALLGLYTFRKHVTNAPEYGDFSRLTIIDSSANNITALQEGVRIGSIVATATILARDMVNEPSNFMTPTDLAAAASKIANQHSLEITILDKDQVRDLGMGAFLGVSQGSQQPPKFIVLRYNGKQTNGIDVALVGKGITFDSGGISIKPSEGMSDMKGDMAGGASVIAAIGAIAELKAKVNVMAIVAATENLPSGTALKPGNVLKSMSGKTIEIITTDAEGRLTLADAIGYARKQGARIIIDIATLTGAIQVALGNICTGVFGNNQDLINRVISAGEKAGERAWQMPMFDEYKEQNKSDVADIRNSGGRPASSITAAQFLAEFAGDTPWVHLDIAGTSDTDKERGYLVKGATGVPVRTLLNFLLSDE
jgi:leucyl aminopeptidase